MSAEAAIRRARARIAHAWRPGISLDDEGRIIFAEMRGHIERWSLFDALSRDATVEAFMAAWDLVQTFAQPTYAATLYDWEADDRRTQAEILTVLARAALRAEAMERA